MQTSRAHIGWFMLLIGSMLAGACSSTQLRSSWFSENGRDVRLNKVAVFVLSENEDRARIAESVIANQLGASTQPGHQILQPGDAGSKDRVEARLRSLGYDGAISVRLLSVEDKEKYIPPMIVQPSPGFVMPGYLPGMGFYSYYGHVYQPPQVIPGYTAKYKEVVVESIAYSLRSNEPVWIGITETRNPDSVSDAAEEIGAAIHGALRKADLLK